jgi:hypothetical protein
VTEVLVATGAGCMTFDQDSGNKIQFPGQVVRSIARDPAGGCLAVVDGNQIWRRDADTDWSLVTTTEISLDALTLIDGQIVGATPEAALVRVDGSGKVDRLTGFDTISGREQWFAHGPPLHVRALTATADGAALMAAVHVGGIPRSTDGGKTWAPTVPIDFDIHEVRAHPTLAHIVFAAAAVGLCVSEDGGSSWRVLSEGPEDPHSLAIAALDGEVLFSVQDGPFAARSQVWRWRIGDSKIEQVRDGLPEWFSGKVDTAHMAAGNGRAAIVDGGGSLWLSEKESSGWHQIASQVPYALGSLIL